MFDSIQLSFPLSFACGPSFCRFVFQWLFLIYLFFWFLIYLCVCLLKYTLDVQALVSVSLNHKSSSCHHLVSQFSRFFPYCSLSYLGLITGSDVEKMTTIVIGGNFSLLAIFADSLILAGRFFIYFSFSFLQNAQKTKIII